MKPNFRLYDNIVKEEEESRLKFKLQEKYCFETGKVIFVDIWGTCTACGNNIWLRITEQEASSKHITACPICKTSFCE